MMVSVDVDMATSIQDAQEALNTFPANPNDHDDYITTIKALDCLVVGILRAASAHSLLSPASTGARFDYAPESLTGKSVRRAIDYLRSEAVEVSGDKLSRYEDANTIKAYGHLMAVYGTVLSSVVNQARRDLTELGRTSPGNMLILAKAAADAASKAEQSN